MKHLQYTLVTDGPSDRLLLHPIDWLLERLTELDFDGEWANPAILGRRSGLARRLAAALDSYPCELLFVHRDAEKEPRDVRVDEIESAVAALPAPPAAVCVVPVRMTEAWLLIDAPAIREAAGNPNGRVPLELPDVKALESLADPKQRLFALLRTASELSPRRLRRFRRFQARQRVAELVADFSPLEALPAFRELRDDLRKILGEREWA